MKNGFVDDAVGAWEKSLQLDPKNEEVKKKLEETRDKQRSVKGERSKAQP
jgi:cytochrome c-type biogenesis protein CcmH/NrfG